MSALLPHRAGFRESTLIFFKPGIKRTHKAAQALMVQVNALLPHKVGEAASSDRRAAEKAEQMAEREGKLAMAEQHMVPPRIEVLRGIGSVAVEN